MTARQERTPPEEGGVRTGPVRVQTVNRRAFRPAWVGVDDLPLLGWLGLTTWLGTVAAVGITLAPRAPAAGFEAYADRPEVHWVQSQPKPEAEELPAVLKPPPTVVPKPEVEPVRTVRAEPQEPPVESPRDAALVRHSLRERMRMRVARLGRAGQGDPQLDGLPQLAPSGDVPTLDGPRRIDLGGDAVIGGGLELGSAGVGEVDEDYEAVVSPPPPTQPPPIPLDPPSAPSGTLPADLVGGFQYCFERELRAGARSGTVRFSFSVANERVTSVRIVESTVGDESMHDCMLSRVRRWRMRGFVDGVHGPFSVIFRAQ